MPPPPKSQSERFRLAARIALAVCVVSALAAGVLMLSPEEPCYDPSDPSCAVYDAVVARQQDWQLERIGGTALIYTTRFNRWLAIWFHGARLAGLISAVSLAVALWCYREARWLREEEAKKDDSGSDTA
jgi:hypothetical protein